MMAHAPTITYLMFLIFSGTALLATVALFTRQSLLIAYIVLGALLGPWGFKLINNASIIKEAGDVGIIFLLFLLGLDLQPQNLFHSLRKMSLVALSSSLLFFAIGFVTTRCFGHPIGECFMIGVIAMFSSTIIGIKLLPTTILHHQHTGELVISILLLQDILAIAVLLGIEIMANRANFFQIGLMLGALPSLIVIAYIFQKYILSALISRFDQIHEYLFILFVGWCLCLAELSHLMGLSEDIGAFIAGVSLASNPISNYIVETLKPLRDFFLILFFFTIGATFSFEYFNHIAFQAAILAALILVFKPIIFRVLLRSIGEIKTVGWEIGIRLGQLSEFSLLIIYMAFDTQLLTPEVTYMAEAAVIFTFIVSCYWTVLKYPTPLGLTANLRRD
jgi:Kef-type K+ transport system membrane component KefB